MHYNTTFNWTTRIITYQILHWCKYMYLFLFSYYDVHFGNRISPANKQSRSLPFPWTIGVAKYDTVSRHFQFSFNKRNNADNFKMLQWVNVYQTESIIDEQINDFSTQIHMSMSPVKFHNYSYIYMYPQPLLNFNEICNCIYCHIGVF